MQIDIHYDPSNAIPPFRAKLGRITVLIGANGAGKSKLLNTVMDKCVSIVGGNKIMRLHPLGHLGDVGFEHPDLLSQTQKKLSEQVVSHTRAAANDARFYIKENQILSVLHAKDAKDERDELTAFHKHKKAPEENPAPPARVSNFELLCDIFNAIVDVKLTFDRDTQHFAVDTKRQPSHRYTIDKLSSGEKWIFRTLPALLQYQDEDMVVFVDEPETMLNEQLAVDFWTHIENIRPNWKFVYATHNVSFAARQSVENLFLLKSTFEEPQKISHVSELNSEDKRSLLGIGPRLAQTKNALFVEGKDASLDVPFYSALLNRQDILISSIGGSKDVIKATTQSGYWENLQLENLNIIGAIDRDFLKEEEKLPSHVVSMNLHDLEAHLCLPQLLSEIGAITGGETSVERYETLIFAHARSFQKETVFQHLDRLFPSSRTISVPKEMRNEADLNGISGLYIQQRKELVRSIEDEYSDSVISTKILEISSSIQTAIDGDIASDILVWFSGKRLIYSLCEVSQVRDPNQIVNLMKIHNLVEEIPELLALKGKLNVLFPNEE